MGFWSRLKEKLFGTEEERQQKKLDKQRKKEEKKLLKLNFKKEKKEKVVSKYVEGLSRSNKSFIESIKAIQNKYNKIDDELFEELEDLLVMSDISYNLVEIIIDECKKEVKNENISDPKLISEIIADKLFAIYASNSVIDSSLNIYDGRLNIILVIGVNGSGKTTSISKIAHKLVSENKKVLIAAADTFRAAAVEQLEIWSKRVNADIVKPLQNEIDPAAVVYRALEKATEDNYDVLIIDTAGRLQNKVNLMHELAKINKIIKNKIPEAPHETLLVMDASTGQNGISQAKEFKEFVDLTGIILTKMDGTSKGGVALTIKDQLDLIIKFIGFGEKIDDLMEFELDAYIYGLMKGFNEQ
ncbi:cell division protein FtsY [Metamycoplasma hyosynoviae]|uniref:signal recognition particle-docking protein FtsY n=1 Tax=Metamycoplasma hyosynoviae TaxID=29559 RepID=UPI0004616481|nr:signal recognition particle-docking protein FtsY [Metamycoplasma hyosynoviae]KDE41787.1 cell division protein FtsY [Metamycoplasma hyosynoviae]KDE42045.1 cell division protein FtsY [Metamycoplasma hyosynoviae]KDE42788.1 cell division protein FtsY [Metamycoplasma hyosynoviae]KDE43433.1 cell division protein FtsY [Metamycoplasma hyosynoviae]KDE44267.1 cell division protein FtsY [Metamycoplasma hyosynoviae]